MPRHDSSATPVPPDAGAPGMQQAPTTGALFAGFFGIGITGFGGVLPFARRMIVEKRRWLTGPEFTDMLALCQLLPGPNIVNISVALGSRFRGLPGALAAMAGLLLAPIAIVLALSTVYVRFSGLASVRHAFAGLAAAASGLVIAMGCKIAGPLRGSPVAMAVALVAFAAVGLFRLPLLPTLFVLAPVSILVRRRFPG